MRDALVQRLRAVHLEDDREFDRLYPEWARRVSRGNWTPLAVARRAAELLAPTPDTRVLDVGSGVGKLCIVGALATGAHFRGVELRKHFVDAARAAAVRLGLRTASFTCGDMADVDWRPYGSFYLFNPFAEYWAKLLEPFDPPCAVDQPRHARYVGHVQEQLDQAPPGTRVVTYNGFGGEFPAAYRLDHVEPAGSDRLELWMRA
jgi:SAM-dependent methyltransferase